MTASGDAAALGGSFCKALACVVLPQPSQPPSWTRLIFERNAYNAFPSTRKNIIIESGRNFKYSVVVLHGGPRFPLRFFLHRASVIRGQDPFGESLPAHDPRDYDTDNGWKKTGRVEGRNGLALE